MNSIFLQSWKLWQFHVEFHSQPNCKEDELSFHSPRVTIDNGNSTKYFLIFQDTGFVELATLKNNIFTSGAIVNYGGYDLTNPLNSIQVGVLKILDQVEVQVDENQISSFPLETSNSSVSISSEESVSKFTDITLSTQNTTRLFAIRQSSNQQDFTLKYSSSEKSVLEIQNETSEYAVVVQYLNNPSRKIEPQVQAASFQANMFFNGWIINPENNTNSEKTTLTIELENSQLTYGLFYFLNSIHIFSYYCCNHLLEEKKNHSLFTPLRKTKKLG